MITQGSNRPLVIGLPLSVSEAEEIHVLLYGSTGEIKHWKNDGTDTDIEVSTEGNCLICAMTQEDTAGFPAGRAHCVVKWLDDDGIVHQTKAMPISIKAFADRHIMGDDEAVTTTDIYYEGSLEDCQGILTPESIRTAIVIKAGTVSDTQAQAVVNAWLTAHASQIKGAKGDKGDKGDTGATGQTGPAGATGAKGDKGDPGEVTYIENPYDDTQIKQDIAALQTGKANATHSHAIADVTGLQAVVDKVNAMYPDYTSALALLGGDS